MASALDVPSVIAAEAASGTREERWADMVAIASVISNRAQQLGVSMQDVIANSDEFNAYGNRMPPGTANLVDMAQEAIDYVAEQGPTTRATYYATPEAVPNLPDGLSYETETTGHQYFSDPHGRAIRTAAGTLTPNQYAFAQNLTDVPTPYSPAEAGIPRDLLAAEQGRMPGHWGLNPDVAPVPYETFNQWEAMANAPPIQAPAQGLLSSSSDVQNFADGMTAQRQTVPQQSIPTLNNFEDLANAGPMGGDYAAPQDRFAGVEPSQSQPFDRYVNTTSFPPSVDYGAYPPGSAPMMDTSAVAPNRVQSISYTPGLEAGVSANLLSAAVPSVDPAANVDAAQNRMDGLLGPSFAEMDFSRMAPGQKTSRIGSNQMEDMGRMLPSIDPMTNTQSFMNQPANLGSFPAGYTAQRGPTTGLLSADFQSLVGNTERQLQDPASLAPNVAASGLLASQSAISPATSLLSSSPIANIDRQLSIGLPTGLLSDQPLQQSSLVAGAAVPNFQSTITTPGQMTGITTPEQQAAGYQQLAASAPNITNLSGFTGIFDDGTGYQNAVPAQAQVPDLQQVEVADQPSIASVDVPGPATISATDQQRQASTRTAVRSNPVARSNPSLLTAAKNAINPGTAIGGLIGGGLLSAPGAIAGGLLGNAVYQNGGFRGLLSQPSYSINPIGSGVQAAYSVWGGGTPIGSQAVATDGSRITQMPGGLIGVTGPSGVTTAFDNTGKGYAVFGGMFSNNEQDEDTESESEGGLFSGW